MLKILFVSNRAMNNEAVLYLAYFVFRLKISRLLGFYVLSTFQYLMKNVLVKILSDKKFKAIFKKGQIRFFLFCYGVLKRGHEIM